MVTNAGSAVLLYVDQAVKKRVHTNRSALCYLSMTLGKSCQKMRSSYGLSPLFGFSSWLPKTQIGTKSVEVFRPTLRQGRSRRTSLKHKLAQVNLRVFSRV